MGSLDLDFPLNETTDSFVNKFGISKNNFRDLLNLSVKEPFFTYNNKFYIQVGGVSMGSPISPILTNIFLSHHEEN